MQVTVIDSDHTTYKIVYKKYEYANLMELMVNTFYSEVGACRGKGLCGTCCVEVIDRELNDVRSKQEEHTLIVHDLNKKNNRLSCQLFLDENIDGTVCKIIDFI